MVEEVKVVWAERGFDLRLAILRQVLTGVSYDLKRNHVSHLQ